MKGFNTHRHESNPKEKELHDQFIEHVSRNHDTLSRLVLGSSKDDNFPKDYLASREEKIAISAIQWLGSPVGQGFLRDCGYELKE